MSEIPPIPDPAFPVMAMDILRNVLSRADNPAEVGPFITEEIRELTGAGCVVLIQCLGTSSDLEYRVLSVNPSRRSDWAHSANARRLYEIAHALTSTRVWRADDDSQAAGILRQEGFGLSLAVTLDVGATREGAMLVLDLVDDQHLEAEMHLLHMLSRIMALALRNASFFQQQEKTILERTRELQTSNESLRLREAEARQLLEIAERSRRALESSIEERVQAERLLRATEEQFRRAVIDSPFPIMLHAEDGAVLQISQSWCDISGYSAEELTTIGDWAERAYGERMNHVRAQIDELYQLNHRKYEGDYTIRTKSGDSRIWEFSSAPLGLLPDGRRLVISMGMDVTERRKSEQSIQQLNSELEQRVRERTSKLEISNKELEAFSYSVSHDLRAPLRGIDGWSLALMEDFGAQLDPRARQYLERVRSETERMGLLIDDLLELSRVSRAEVCMVSIDLSALAQRIADRLQTLHPNRQIEFLIEAGAAAHGDPRLIEIVLNNLLENACKFTGKREKARIEFGKTNEAPDSDSLPSNTFFVRDNGAGFDMAYAKKLFGSFQRLHKASEFPGTGIGLTTVQRIIHRHGGRVWARAKVDEGAEFFFSLPEQQDKS